MNITGKIKSILKKNRFIFTLYIRFSSKEYQLNLKGFRIYRRENPDKVKREISLMKNYWNSYPTQYIRYKLFYENLSDEQLLDYIPAYYFYVKHLDEMHKDINRDKMALKLPQYFLFKDKDIPTPTVCGIIKNNKITDLQGNLIDINVILNANLIDDTDKLFIKPIGGAGGKGIQILEKKGSSFLLDKNLINISDFLPSLDRKEQYILQKGIIQRSDINKINPYCVNTLRVVAQKRNGVMDMRVCVMRIGRNKSFVDNSAKGGISIQIDIETGKMNKYATAEHGNQNIFYVHPDTNFKFENYTIRGWEIIRDQISEISEKLSEYIDIALDIAITEEGVQLIEINFKTGIDHLQISCGGMRRVLNVYPE